MYLGEEEGGREREGEREFSPGVISPSVQQVPDNVQKGGRIERWPQRGPNPGP